jgi:hypothetical protein
MISKSDWETACDDLIAAGRKRHEPPTAEEVEALFLGNLPEPEAARVREVLVYYPEMALAMTEPFPEDAEGVLTDAELTADLAKIKSRLQPVPLPAPVVFPARRSRIPWAIAA